MMATNHTNRVRKPIGSDLKLKVTIPMIDSLSIRDYDYVV